LPELNCSGYESQAFDEPASMQAEIYKMLKDGKLNAEEFEIRFQQAKRKVSISHNSNEQ